MFMNGVDRSDQMRTEYSMARSYRKWWTYIFWFLVDLSISNCFFMNESPNRQQLDEHGSNKRTMLFFHQQLAKQLMSSYREGRKRKRSVRRDVSGAGHWPLKLEKRKDCAKPGYTGESRFICTGCSDLQRQNYAHICVQRHNCFYEYHTQPHDYM